MPGVPRSCCAAAAVLLGVGVAVAPSAPALAAAGCTTTTPALDAAISCTTAGTEDIAIPSGATHVRLKVTGAGGGGSRAAVGWASGGKGAVISGWAELPIGTDHLTVRVGAGGAAGVAGAGDTLGGGGGGGASGVFAYAALSVPIGTLVIAGGGGGAGGRDVSDVGQTNAAGGDARAAGVGFTGDYEAAGGSPGTGFTGGAGGAGQVSGTAGAGAVWGAIAAGGTGASIITRRGGTGGGGYAGGGGGAAQNLAEATAGSVGTLGSDPEYIAGGGGGGSNYLNFTAMPVNFIGLAGASGAGSGSSGLAANDSAVLPDGAAGAIEVKFREGKPPPDITSVSPTSGPVAGGSTLTVTGTDLEGASYVGLGMLSCTNVVVVSSTEVTCTVPNGVTPGTLAATLTSPNGTDTLNSAYTYTAPTISTVSPTSGLLAGGGTLTITGTNLTGTSAVTVGGTACTPIVNVSVTEVTCTIPARLETGTYAVALTATAGAATKTSAYTYTEGPEVTSVSPVTGVLAGGGTLTINGTNLTGTSAVSLGGGACTNISNVSATQVTCTIPARLTTGSVNLALTATAGTASLTNAYTYTQPAPTIVSVSPTSGLLSGGGTLTITGTNLSLTSAVMLFETECTNIVNVSATQVTCTIPAGMALGPVQVSVTTAGGYIASAGAYTYVAAPTNSPPTTTPTTPPTTPPTTAPPTTEPTPEPTPSTAPRLQLTLDLEVNSPVVGAQAVMTGGGLRSESKYVLTMRSTPVQVASGVTDEGGNFQAQIKLPGKVCVSGGLHELVLTGITPDGDALRDSSWIVLDDNCKTRSVRKAKPVNNTVTLGSFIFPYLSARLTPHSKSVLRSLRTSMKTAKRVTITGYTQTTKKSAAAKKFNRALAKRRSAAVRAYLRSVGVKAPFTIVGAGGVKPLKGKAQKYNRRVVITVRY